MSDSAPLSPDERSELQRLRVRVRELEASRQAETESPSIPLDITEFIHSLPQVVFETDLEGRFRFANQHGLKEFGYTLGDIENGISVYETIIPEDREKARSRMIEAVRDNNRDAMYYTAQRKDGTRFPVLVHTRPVYRNGRPDGIVGMLVDVTNLRLAQNELQQQIHQTQAILQAIPDIVFLLDRDGRYLDVLTCEDDLLYRTKEELVGKRLHDLLPVEVADLALSAIHEAIETGESRIVEYSLEVPAGTCWFEGRTAAVADAQGERKHVVFAAHDITSRKTAELALQNANAELEDRVRERTRELEVSNARHAIILECASDIVYLMTPDGRFISLNPSFETILGWKARNWVGRPFMELMHPGDTDMARDMLQVLRSGNELPPREGRIRTASGEYRVLETLSRAYTEEGEVKFLAGVARDVTERRRTEARLRESEERYRSLFETAPDIVYTADTEGLFTSLNTAFEKITGYARAEWIGRPFYELIHPDDLSRTLEHYRSAMKGESTPPIVVRARMASGEYRVFEAIAASDVSKRKDAGAFGVVRDITERKRTEDALLQSERMAAVGTLSAGVAHEFNNIHTSVLGFLELLLERPFADEDRFMLERVHRAVLRASRVTRNLLAFARPERTSRRRRFVNEVIKEILSLVQGEFESEGVEINVRFGDVPPVDMDAAQIGQVLMNLVINARHAVFEQPVQRITIESGADGQRVFLRVSDTGCGIAEKDVPKLFLPFFSTKGEHAESSSPQSRVRGTGLGLSVSDTIVRQHEGEIKVRSVPGEGAEFTVWLPASQGADVADVAVTVAPPNLSGSRVLVLDDEVDVRELLESILVRLGAQVIASDDGDEALRLHARLPFDIALVDLQMPKMAGHRFLELAADALSPPLCLVVTGRPDALAGEGAPGVFASIVKPFEIFDLYISLSKALQALEGR